jgi:hypothetical protein
MRLQIVGRIVRDASPAGRDDSSAVVPDPPTGSLKQDRATHASNGMYNIPCQRDTA